MSFHIAGDLFDAQSFILDVVDHSISTLTPCSVAHISREAMLEITEDYPRLARAIWRETLLEAAIFREWVVNVGLRDAAEAAAHLICEVFFRRETVGLTKGNSTEWPITQTELGYALGLSNVHVNRTLQELRRRNLITLGNGTLVITDMVRLKETGLFDETYLHFRQKGSKDLDGHKSLGCTL